MKKIAPDISVNRAHVNNHGSHRYQVSRHRGIPLVQSAACPRVCRGMTDVVTMPATRDGRWAVLPAVGLVVLLAISMRLWINFSTTLPPSMDAAYYPTQARWLIEHGRLMYDDMPLYFWLCAGTTRLLIQFGMGQDGALLLASRTLDSLLHPLAAIPIVLWTFRVRAQGRSIRTDPNSSGNRVVLAAAAASMTAVVSLPAARMASDFQKNSLALVWMSIAIYALCAAAEVGQSRQRRASAMAFGAALILMLALCALTHYGTFGACMLVVGAIVVHYQWFRGQRTLRGVALPLVGSLGAGLAIWAAVYMNDPVRALRLARAPLEIFNPFERKGFGPAGNLIPVSTGAYVIGPLVLWRLRRERRGGSINDPTQAVAAGTAMAAMLLACPIMSREYAMRLALMAPVPMAFALGYLLSRRAEEHRSPLPGVAAALAAIASALVGLGFPRPAIAQESVEELISLRQHIAEPERTLVVSTHGLEWWAGYFLRTPVRLGSAPSNAFDRYERVLILESKRSHAPHRAPRGSRPRPPGGEPPSPGGQLRIPGETAVLHDGPHYRLHEMREQRP